MESAKKLIYGDKSIWMAYGVLCFFSILVLFSASARMAHSQLSVFGPVSSHIQHLLLGALLVLAVSNIHYAYYKILGFVIYPFIFLALIYLLIWGKEVNGGARWIDIFGIPFQPSEAVKIFITFFVPMVLAKMDQEDEKSQKSAMLFIVLGIGPLCLLVLFENFSSAAFLVLITLIMMFFGGVKVRYYLSHLKWVLLVILFFVALAKFKPDNPITHRLPTWYGRITQFLTEQPIPKSAFEIPDKQYQSMHAKMAVASGFISPIGKSLGNGEERAFLPEAHSDFIFAILVEEWGWIGVLCVFASYITLLFRARIIAQRCKKHYPAYLVMCAATILCLQAFTNISVAVGILPVTGQPLPFISKGGSSIIISSILLGVMLSVSKYAVDTKALNAEFDEDHDEELQIHS